MTENQLVAELRSINERIRVMDLKISQIPTIRDLLEGKLGALNTRLEKLETHF